MIKIFKMFMSPNHNNHKKNEIKKMLLILTNPNLNINQNPYHKQLHKPHNVYYNQQKNNKMMKMTKKDFNVIKVKGKIISNLDTLVI